MILPWYFLYWCPPPPAVTSLNPHFYPLNTHSWQVLTYPYQSIAPYNTTESHEWPTSSIPSISSQLSWPALWSSVCSFSLPQPHPTHLHTFSITYPSNFLSLTFKSIDLLTDNKYRPFLLFISSKFSTWIILTGQEYRKWDPFQDPFPSYPITLTRFQCHFVQPARKFTIRIIPLVTSTGSPLQLPFLNWVASVADGWDDLLTWKSVGQ